MVVKLTTKWQHKPQTQAQFRREQQDKTFHANKVVEVLKFYSQENFVTYPKNSQLLKYGTILSEGQNEVFSYC